MRQALIEGDGLHLHVQSAGTGPPVVLLHGFPENGRSWKHQVPALVAGGFSAWVPNLRGYPPSEISPRRSDYHLRHLVDDVAAVVAATGYGRASVVGHDWGGIIAWTFAGARPDLLDKLVILNAPHMGVYAQKVWRTSQLLRSAYIGLFRLPYLPEWALSFGNFFAVRQTFRLLAVRRDAFGDDEIDAYVRGLSHPGALTAALDYYRANIGADGLAGARSARTDAPVSIIWGERDPALGSFLLEGTQRYAPRLRIHRIRHAGHWVHRDAPEVVNRLLLAFLGQSG